MAAAAIIFFAFYGFDAIATAAEEAKNPSRDLAIGIVGSMVVCVAHLHGRGCCGAIGAVAYTGFADSAEPLALILREIGQPWAARVLGASGGDRAADGHPRLLLRPEPHLLHRCPRRAAAQSAWRAFRAAGTPVRITIFTAIVTSVFAGLIPLDRDRRAGQCRNAGGVRRGLRGDAGAAPPRAEPRSANSELRRHGWSASVGILGCIYLFISLPNRTQLFFLGAQVIGILLYSIYGARRGRAGASACLNAVAPPRRSRLKNILGGSAGNLVEWFDWYVYGSFALYFASAFFPKGDQTAQLAADRGDLRRRLRHAADRRLVDGHLCRPAADARRA